MASKKTRSPNFTQGEKDLFVEELLPKFREFIECKKSDHISLSEKASKWSQLADEFNAKSKLHFRSVQNLQNLWDNLKKSARHAAAQEKRGLYATGGGERITSSDPTSRDIKVLAVLGSSGAGLENPYDGDSGDMSAAPATLDDVTEMLYEELS